MVAQVVANDLAQVQPVSLLSALQVMADRRGCAVPLCPAPLPAAKELVPEGCRRESGMLKHVMLVNRLRGNLPYYPLLRPMMNKIKKATPIALQAITSNSGDENGKATTL